jgi:glycosyltransferase involved in cell wall biosynthesis
VKILQITYSLSSGGAERLSVELSNQLAEMGHEVYLCVIRDLSEAEHNFYLPELLPSVSIINLKIPKGFSFRYFSALYRTIAEVCPDVVHSHLNIIRYVFFIRPFFPRLRFVHTIHNDAPKEVDSRLEWLVCRTFFSKHWIEAVTISDETSQSFVHYYGVQPAFQIHNGRSKVKKSPAYQETYDYIQSLKKTPSTVTLLHVARFAPQKNQQLLVNVVNQLAREGHDLQLIMVGGGFDSPDAQPLRAVSGPTIHFAGMRLNVGDYYFAADGFCLSSLYEGMPISLIEAWCCGCIPVCTPVGGCRGLINNGENGFLSADCSEKAYYDAVLRFLREYKSIDKKNLEAIFEKEFSIQQCAEKYLNAYRPVNPDRKN